MNLETRAETLLKTRGLHFYEHLNGWGYSETYSYSPVDLRNAVKTINEMTKNLNYDEDGSDMNQVAKGFYYADYLMRLTYTLKNEYTKINRSLKLWSKNETKLAELTRRINSYEIVYSSFMKQSKYFANSPLFKTMMVEQIAMRKATKKMDEVDSCVDFNTLLQQMKLEEK
tara:strand:- start:30 stop:542 length:513 start_codon:yes stop_codon:yes gene_type:complete